MGNEIGICGYCGHQGPLENGRLYPHGYSRSAYRGRCPGSGLTPAASVKLKGNGDAATLAEIEHWLELWDPSILTPPEGMPKHIRKLTRGGLRLNLRRRAEYLREQVAKHATR